MILPVARLNAVDRLIAGIGHLFRIFGTFDLGDEFSRRFINTCSKLIDAARRGSRWR